ncbi:hypothetical protein EXE43_16085 [Halorubrum sp. SS5]|nr:hypothetical protein EXE43_16085 [Halorubrum sp. SS5]
MTELSSSSRDRILAETEDVELAWKGEIEQEEEESVSCDFLATDRRLMYSARVGHLKDIDYDHISSVESHTETNSKLNPDLDYPPIFALGLVIGAIGGGLSLGSGNLLLAIVLWIGGSLVAAYPLIAGDTDEVENPWVEETVYKIRIRTTGDTIAQDMAPQVISTRENIGPDLSRIVQENK